MPYSNNWFERDAQTKFEKYLSDLTIDTYLELGCCEGASLLWVYENLKPEAIYAVDAWKARKRSDQEAFDKYKANFDANTQVIRNDPDCDLTVLQDDTRRALCYLTLGDAGNEEPMNLVYVDAGHTAYDCLHDMVLSYGLMAVGGHMVVDDLNRKEHRGQYLVHPAVMQFEFLMMNRLERVWLDGRQICWKKTG